MQNTNKHKREYSISYHRVRRNSQLAWVVVASGWRCPVNHDVYLCVSSVPVTYCSHRALEYPRPNSIGSGSTASTTISQSSSSSGRGSLPPIGWSRVEGHHAVCSSSSSEALVENELNNLHLRQHHPLHDCDQQTSTRIFLRMSVCFFSRNITSETYSQSVIYIYI